MVILSPQDLGLFPFQMAELHGLERGVTELLTTYWSGVILQKYNVCQLRTGKSGSSNFCFPLTPRNTNMSPKKGRF